MTISKELLDELLSGVERPEDLLGDKGLMKELKVRLMERMPAVIVALFRRIVIGNTECFQRVFVVQFMILPG